MSARPARITIARQGDYEITVGEGAQFSWAEISRWAEQRRRWNVNHPSNRLDEPVDLMTIIAVLAIKADLDGSEIDDFDKPTRIETAENRLEEDCPTWWWSYQDNQKDAPEDVKVGLRQWSSSQLARTEV